MKSALKREPFQVLLARWLAERDAKRASRTRLGMEGYAYLCAMLRDQPSTARGLEQRAQLGHVAAYRFLLTMHTLKEVHICGWQVAPKVRPLPIFALGPCADVQPPARRPNGRVVLSAPVPQKRLCPGVMAFVHLKRAMEMPADRRELMEATGLNHQTISTAVDVLVALNLAHISCWTDRQITGVPLLNVQWGPGDNAPRPRNTRRQQRQMDNGRRQAARPFQALQLAFAPVANQAQP